MAANGRLEAEVPIPARQVTACVFGGEGREVLYVTTARTGMDKAALTAQPLAGGVFRIQTKVTGMPTFAFAG